MHSSKPVIAHGWLRAVMLFCFLLGVVYLFSSVTNSVIASQLLKNQDSIFGGISKGLWLSVLISFASGFISVWVFRKLIDRRSIMSLGLAWKGNSNHALTGAFAAIAMIGIATLLLIAMDYLHFTQWNLDPVAFISSIIIMLLVTISEELIFRGYLLNNLLQSTGKWLALVVSAVLFAAVHARNPAAGILPVTEVFIGGIMLGINYIYTRNLWFGIFLHFAWNFFQGPVLGYEVSGVILPSVMKQDLSGPTWLTGGAFGLEGSVLAIVLNLLLIAGLIAVYNRREAVVFKNLL